MCKVYTGYYGTSEIEHGLCACTVDKPLAKSRGLSPYRRTNHALFLTYYLEPWYHSISCTPKLIRQFFVFCIARNFDIADIWCSTIYLPGRIAQSVAHLTQEPEVPGLTPQTFVSPSADSRRAIVSYWRSTG